jgi:hypothetical protein
MSQITPRKEDTPPILQHVSHDEAKAAVKCSPTLCATSKENYASDDTTKERYQVLVCVTE